MGPNNHHVVFRVILAQTTSSDAAAGTGVSNRQNQPHV